MNSNFIEFYLKIIDLIDKKNFYDFYDMENIFDIILSKVLSYSPLLTTGSIILRDDDGYFKYIAAKGHDFNILKNIVFKKNNIFKYRFYSTNIVKNKIESETTEQLELLIKGGNLLNIKSYLSVPILINNENFGFLNIDNYSDKNIFDDNITKMAKDYSKFIASIYKAIIMKKELNLKTLLLRKTEIINNYNIYSKNFLIQKARDFFKNYEEFIFINIKIKNNLEEKELNCIINRLHKLFEDDFVFFDNNNKEFFILSEYISNYYFETNVKNELLKPIFWNYELIPEFEFYFYNIPDDINNIENFKKIIDHY
ncbi:hypothetical protein SAMN02745164_00450 [Marinitoga hydrogenitolerans DSM 16785]|uniref:GAF domain-containing protein n=1 Tax=Marinitoga hydrogenitolerans (strain DSM 16785 / JCM 12826 / AT1271) TaxID=1122195 RepID=A0A1M4TIM3_MARH1|nr:hypothetical protein [Marinitoga hydrogenitolerans]SHE44286.1 hypothetical protein SAMN02745164_00450 [Marinitoga hydrogenitolerans DSM 16785]